MAIEWKWVGTIAVGMLAGALLIGLTAAIIRR
jgi:hypothetical protein